MRAECFTLISSCCHVPVCFLCLFNEVLWLGLHLVIVSLPGHTHVLFGRNDPYVALFDNFSNDYSVM